MKKSTPPVEQPDAAAPGEEEDPDETDGPDEPDEADGPDEADEPDESRAPDEPVASYKTVEPVEPVEPAEPAEPARGPAAWRANVLPALLSVLLAAVVVTAGSLVYDRLAQHDDPAPTPADIRRDGPAGPPLGTSAVSMARRATLDYFGLDYRHLSTAGADLRPASTPDFRREYDAQVAPLRARVRSGRLVLTPRLPADGVATEYLSEHTARILVAVDVTTTSAAGRRATTPYRIRVSLQREDLRWYVAGIDQVDQP